MGPGMSAFAERELLRDRWPPNTDFWDQPQVNGPTAYRDLVAATFSKLEELSGGGKRKVDLIAHSFGGQLARECAGNMGEIVDSVRLISTGPDPLSGFYRLLIRLADDSRTDPALREKMSAFLAARPKSSDAPLWEMVGLIVQDPEFMRVYWPKRSLFEAYLGVAARGPALAFSTFQDVLNDFSRNGPPIPTRITWKGRAELVLGEKDPLMDPDETERFWKACFSDLKVTRESRSGHFPHLEDALRSAKADGIHR